MLHDAVSGLFRQFGRPCFRIYGRANFESDWHLIDVYATHRRNFTSRWPLCRGTCTTWSSGAIAIGADLAAALVREQEIEAAHRDRPVVVRGGRLHLGRTNFGPPTASEILAHECGHTGQARRMGPIYWPFGATLTLCREGARWWNRFENDASEIGQFGGIVAGTVDPRMLG